MEKIFDKLSSYDIFNNLLPGLVFVIFYDYLFSTNIFDEINMFVVVVTSYLIGLFFSRIGSIIIEPILIKIKFISFSDYNDFILASKTDSKIEILLEVANMYRTVFVVSVFAIGITIYRYCLSPFQNSHLVTFLVIQLIITIVFLASYKKQVRYIFNRVKVNNYGTK
jgi:hypothetical protein